mgnify:CR=1 FL=1
MQKTRVFWLLLGSFLVFSCSDLEGNFSAKQDAGEVTIDVSAVTYDNSSRAVTTGGIFGARNMTFSGTVSGSSQIKEISAKIKRPEDEFFLDFKKAPVINGNWSMDLDFGEDDFFFLKFCVEKEEELSSAWPDSEVIIPIILNGNYDADSPLYIQGCFNEDKVNLMSKAALSEIDFNIPENSSIAQNQDFFIFMLSDKINCDKIQIRDEDNQEICTIESQPLSQDLLQFKVEKSVIEKADAAFATGRHFFSVFYESDRLKINAGSFLWWPESDAPKIKIESHAGEDSITAHINSELELTIFDDDSLNSYSYMLLNQETASACAHELEIIRKNPSALALSIEEGKIPCISASTTNKISDKTAKLSIEVPGLSQKLTLLVFANDGTENQSYLYKELTIYTVDDSSTSLIIDSPAGNTIPVPSAETQTNNSAAPFTFEGRTLDSIGCKELSFLWVGGSLSDEEKSAKAKEYFSAHSGESDSSASFSEASTRLWTVELGEAEKSDDFYKQPFRFDIDLLNDFGSEILSDKFFEAKVTRNDGSILYYDFKFQADSDLLEIVSLYFTSDNQGNGSTITAKDTISAVLTFNKEIQLKGEPALHLQLVNSDEKELLTIPLKEISDKSLAFKKEIDSGCGELFYSPAMLISDAALICDKAGNLLSNNTDSGLVSTNYIVDACAPEILSMIPGGETKEGSNIFKNGNEIKIEFSEEVRKAEGNIILRQKAGWALPPVLSEEDFKAITDLLDDEDKEILSRRENEGEMEDQESILASASKYPNDTYHGTGQYVGPYKKTAQGLILSDDGQTFVPDTSPKYVLDFDIGIWETDIPHYFDKSFEKGLSSLQKYNKRGYESLTNVLKISDPAEKKAAGSEITAAKIRAVLEKVNYHQRVLDVCSPEVNLSDDGKSVTISFPAALCDKSEELPAGREWEVVIDYRAFTDKAGNSLKHDDSLEGSYMTVATANGNTTFWSDKVAKPVVRVDRYSYGLGIWQSDKKGNKASRIVADTTNYLPVSHDSIKPTGYVRTRIDCETPGAIIKYSIEEKESEPRIDNPPSAGQPCFIDKNEETFYSYLTETKGLTVSDINGIRSYKNMANSIFAIGNGKYQASFKHYVIAIAEKEGFESSEQGIEGVYQTVVQFVNPKTQNGSSATSSTIGQRDLSIEGKPLSNENYIAPFPLRSKENGSPYLRRCYRENTDNANGKSLDYYWVSYEILTSASFSYYNWKNNSYDWSKSQGIMEAGEFTRFVAE